MDKYGKALQVVKDRFAVAHLQYLRVKSMGVLRINPVSVSANAAMTRDAELYEVLLDAFDLPIEELRNFEKEVETAFNESYGDEAEAVRLLTKKGMVVDYRSPFVADPVKVA